jgi:hypothetical protein
MINGLSRSWHVVVTVLPILVVGFTAQVLMGALTQLLPVMLGRGPAEHKAVAGGGGARLAVARRRDSMPRFRCWPGTGQARCRRSGGRWPPAASQPFWFWLCGWPARWHAEGRSVSSWP